MQINSFKLKSLDKYYIHDKSLSKSASATMVKIF